MQEALHRSRFIPLMAALAVTAWATLWLWGQSPYARYLDHGNWTQVGLAGQDLSNASRRRAGADRTSGCWRLGADAGRNDAADDFAAARYFPAPIGALLLVAASWVVIAGVTA
ncbi:MAG: hypothetical protein WA633_01770 [Stellaceae bacterium]